MSRNRTSRNYTPAPNHTPAPNYTPSRNYTPNTPPGIQSIIATPRFVAPPPPPAASYSGRGGNGSGSRPQNITTTTSGNKLTEVQPGLYMTPGGSLIPTTGKGGWGQATEERAQNKYAADMAKTGQANFQTSGGDLQKVTYEQIGFTSMDDPRANGGFSTTKATPPPSPGSAKLFGGMTYSAAPKTSAWNKTKTNVKEFGAGFFFSDDKRRGVNTLGNLKDTTSPVGFREYGAVAGIITLPVAESGQAVSKTAKATFGLYSRGAARAGTAIERTSVGSKLFKARDAAQAFKVKNVQVGRYGVQTAETLGFLYGATSTVSYAAQKTRPEYSITKQQADSIYSTAVRDSRPGFNYKKPSTYVSTLGFEFTQLAGNKKQFEKSTRSQLAAAGVSNYEADFITRRFLAERRIRGTSEIGFNLFAGARSEELGRQLTANRFARGGTAYTKNAIRAGFLKAFPSIAAAGTQEGMGAYLIQQKSRGERVTPTGLAGYGVAGGLTAGTLGGIDVGLSVNAAAKGTKKARFGANMFDTTLNILDPLEKPGDLVRDYTEGAVSRRTNTRFTSAGTYRGPTTITFTASPGRGLTPTYTNTPTVTKSPSFIKSLVPTSTKQDANIFTNTPTRTKTPTPAPSWTPTFTTTKTFTNTFTPTWTPTWTPTLTTTLTPTPTPTPVPTWTGRGFPILPLAALGGGGAGNRGGRRQSFKYAPSIGAVLFNIKGRQRTGPLTGFEVRPIISKRKPRGKR